MDDLEPRRCADLLFAINPFDALRVALDASRHATSLSDQAFWREVIAMLEQSVPPIPMPMQTPR